MDEESINIRDYIQVLFRRKYLILLVFIVCLPFVALKALSYTPVYTASSKLFVQKNQDQVILSENRYQRYDPAFIDNQIQMIKSSKVGEIIARDLELADTYEQYFPQTEQEPSLIQKVEKWFGSLFQVGLKLAGLGPEEPEQEPDSAKAISEEEKRGQRIKSLGRMISGGLNVTQSAEDARGGDSNIIRVSFTSHNPEFSTRVVNSVASAYRQYLLQMSMDSTSETIAWMQEKAKTQREKLEGSEKKLQTYKKANNIYISGDREELFPQRISELSQRLTQAHADVKELESLYAEVQRISLQEALNLPAVAENELIRSLRRKITDKEQDIDELSQKMGEKHPQMVRAKNDLSALQSKLQTETQKTISSIRNKYELAQGKAESIEGLLEQTKLDAADMSDRLFEYEILERDVNVHRMLYDRLMSRIKEHSATENKQLTDVWVVEQAEVPDFPMNQRPKRTIMLGLAVSLMAGVGLAFFLEHLDDTVKTAEDAEARLDLTVLGMIPKYKEKSVDLDKVVHQKPDSLIAERFRVIRTGLLLSGAQDGGNSVLVTSMIQKTGKTVTTVNLAYALAHSGRRVLLVDADMRQPRIHKIFELSNQAGLSSFLSAETEPVIWPIDNPDTLHVLPSGPVPSNPSELLSSNRLQELLQSLQKTYDYILIDSPPMADVTDAVLISKAVKHTILISRSGVSTYESIAQARNALRSIDAHVLGHIINAVAKKDHHYYHKKYYGTYGKYYMSQPGSAEAS